jgi:trimeric autotransporter adhesin
MSPFQKPFALLFWTMSLSNYAIAQCSLDVVAAGRMPDANDAVLASATWDPDGSGPLPEVLVLAGSFTQVGNASARGIALYDPVSRDCMTLGSGIGSGQITALLVTANNELVVTGDFDDIDGVPASNIARWNGTSWQAIGAGIGLEGLALEEAPNGDLLVGGFQAGTPPLMRWDGSSWTAVGTGLIGRVTALAVLPNGDILAGGNAMMPGLVSVARWDGATWSAFAGNITVPSTTGASVRVLQVLANGDVLAAGSMMSAGGVPAPGIARWDGAAWSGFGSGVQGPVYSVVEEPNGDLVVGGSFTTVGGLTTNRVARWDGATWSALAAGPGAPLIALGGLAAVRTLQRLPGGDLVAGGLFDSAGGKADYVQRWDGAQWGPLRIGTGGRVLASLELQNGDLVLAGDFVSVEGVAANRVARRVNGVWQPMGSGADLAVESIAELPSGDVVVGGQFTSIGGVAANHVARWDGVAWHALGAGLSDTVLGLEVDANGKLLASGLFGEQLAVWDGLAWAGTIVSGSPFLLPGSLPLLVATADGEIFATAFILPLQSGVFRWTGSSWQPLLPFGGVAPFAVSRSGEVSIVNGSFVRRWDGAAWSILGAPFNGRVHALLALPNGDLLAGGEFTTNNGIAMPGLARWNGTAWNPVGSGVAGDVRGLRLRPDGSIEVVGGFTNFDGLEAASFAELASSCPATAVSQGVGCSGSGGLNVLTASTLPWLGSEYASIATGMPANGIAVQVLGLGGTTQSLAAILPQGVPGCVLSVTPDLLDFGVPVAGELELRLEIPFTPSLIAQTFRQQVVPLELDVGGAILAATASNAVELLIGLL